MRRPVLEALSRRPRQPVDSRKAALRLIGWALLLAGLGILSWLAWLSLATGSATKAAQEDLLEQWLRRGEPETPVVGEAAPATTPSNGPVALLRFVRPPGTSLLHEGPLAVVGGVSSGDLAKGPGHYPGSALPGKPGNMAVAGHRTTFGAPFARLDELVPGDEVHVEDPVGGRHVYRVVAQRIVQPEETWVIGSDPLGTGKPTLTLTTCHPRFSNRQRLVVFAELLSG